MAAMRAAEAHGGTEPATAGAVIGPNAVLQLAEALRADGGEAAARAVFDAAGLGALLDRPPEAMVDEHLPAALFKALFSVRPADAPAIAADAGRRTADYIMANRIPGAVCTLLRLLPAPLASRLLLNAIARNAWTFAGSGTCTVSAGQPAVIAIRDNPMAMPGCAWHADVFRRLFGRLVHRSVSVRHAACCHEGGNTCQFEIRYGAAAAPATEAIR